MKRTLAFLLVLTLILGVLTGCGGSTSESTKAPETTAATEKKGCGSVVGCGAVVVVAILGSALVAKKRK